jgi:hypothetical protein
MRTLTFIVMATLSGLVAFAGNTVSAQETKGATALMQSVKTTENVQVKNKKQDRRSFVVDGKSTINSNLKSRGFVGPYEIVAHRERGFFGPSTVETIIFDARDGSLVIVNPSSSPGPGIAIINGGALVGASYLFGHSLKPEQTTVNNGSSSQAGGSSSSSQSGGSTSSAGANNSNTANATGGAGGTGGVASSSATGGAGGTSSATGGTATGGSATGGQATGGSVTGAGTGSGTTVNVNSGSANGNGVINVGPATPPAHP